jgi:hypothetical protein
LCYIDGAREKEKTRMTTEKRYQEALKKIGGAAGLLSLPDQVQEVLKSTTDMETKTTMLELIAEALDK